MICDKMAYNIVTTHCTILVGRDVVLMLATVQCVVLEGKNEAKLVGMETFQNLVKCETNKANMKSW